MMGGIDPNMQDPNMMDGTDPNMQDPNMNDGGDMGQFDTGFDAGVNANEDEDPKKYIQQLTGKLSQSYRSYENENGPDGELASYIAGMIGKAVGNGKDDKTKKKMIKAINTSEGPDEDGMEDMSGDDENQDMNDLQQEEPMMEGTHRYFTKKELLERLNQELDNNRENTMPQKREKKKKSIFNGKIFK